MPPSNCFETGRRSQTQSSVRPFGAETANGCLVLDRRGTTAERHERELKALKDFTHALSKARQESFCPLDTDLSWMSANRKLSGLQSGVANCQRELRLLLSAGRRSAHFRMALSVGQRDWPHGVRRYSTFGGTWG